MSKTYEEKLEERILKLEEETHSLERKLKESKNKDLLKTEFLAILAHETRTPLNAIIGFSEILNKDHVEKYSLKDRTKFKSIVYDSAKTLLEMMEEMGDLTKIEIGELKIEKKEFSLTDLLETEINIFQIRAKNKNLELILGNYEPMEIYSDPKRIKQIVSNLIKNAIKFTDKGYIEINYTKDETNIYIQVKDTGVGVNKDHQKQIFDKYKQVNSNKKGVGGTGLGLNIVKNMSEALGGYVKVESEKNIGSTFTVQLPIQEYN